MKRRSTHATRRIFPVGLRRQLTSFFKALTTGFSQMLRSGSRSVPSLVVGGLMLAFIGLLIVNFIGQVLQSARLEDQRAQLESEVASLRDENADLKGAVEFAESDVNVERISREQLGYAREGDVVLLPQAPLATVAPAADTAAAPVSEAAPAAPAFSNPQRWWEAFFPRNTEQ